MRPLNKESLISFDKQTPLIVELMRFGAVISQTKQRSSIVFSSRRLLPALVLEIEPQRELHYARSCVAGNRTEIRSIDVSDAVGRQCKVDLVESVVGLRTEFESVPLANNEVLVQR